MAAIVLLLVSLAISNGWVGWVLLGVAGICLCAAVGLYLAEERRERE